MQLSTFVRLNCPNTFTVSIPPQTLSHKELELLQSIDPCNVSRACGLEGDVHHSIWLAQAFLWKLTCFTATTGFSYIPRRLGQRTNFHVLPALRVLFGVPSGNRRRALVHVPLPPISPMYFTTGLPLKWLSINVCGISAHICRRLSSSGLSTESQAWTNRSRDASPRSDLVG